MLTIGNEEYRNLEEQVEKNKSDILFILEEEGTLNQFGIKVVGQIANASGLPDPATYTGEFGDAYAVGTESPYVMYIYTRANGTHPNNYWFNIGRFPVPGPQGPVGATGPQGLQGSKGDTGATGAQGKQGPQGIQGPVGPRGPQGIQGVQGPMGAPGRTFQVVGVLNSASALPTPTQAIRNEAYLIPDTAEPGTYDLYIITGTTSLVWENTGHIETVQGPKGDTGAQGPTGPQGPIGAQGPTGPQGPQGDPGTNPNLLINPNFAINQRGQASYTGAVYGVDRWKGISSIITATPVINGIQLSSSGTTNTYIKQIIETNLADKTVTASCKLSAINSGEGGRLAVYYSTNGTSWTLINGITIATVGISKLTATIPANAVYVSVDIGVRPSSDVVFEWAKLEIGSVATEFSPPSIAEELQKCHRYYKKITNLQSLNYFAFGMAYGDGNGARMIVENTFRVKPTIDSTGNFAVVANGENKTVSSMAIQSFNSTNIIVKFTLNSALTDGLCGYLQANNSVGAYIGFDAEL